MDVEEELLPGNTVVNLVKNSAFVNIFEPTILK